MRRHTDQHTSRPVLRLGEDRAPEVVDVLCDAFADYPVMRFVLGPRDGDYDRRLHRLIAFFVTARLLRGEPVLGVEGGAGLGAAALVSFPGAATSPPELHEIRDAVWTELGAAARARYDALDDAVAAFTVDVPHIHLNLIGVRPALQGTGLGRRLLDAVHRISREDPRSRGVTLTTEVPANVDFYRHFGYELIGHVTVSPELESWGMFRRD